MNNTAAHGVNIVAIGGGTGLSTMLRGLKTYSPNITAIVTVADDGGGSGVLRAELGMPPPGDIRNCIEALANTEATMEKLLSYRFTEGQLKGQSFGNLFLAALNGMSDTFDTAVSKMSEVLAITGRVLPVTNESVYITAKFDDGSSVVGESTISAFKCGSDKRIVSVDLMPKSPPALPDAIEAIDRADLILLGPGSLYTSIIPNLLTDGIVRAISRSRAIKIYVLNIMTQDGETEGCTASDHISAIFNAAGEQIFDICLANSTEIPGIFLERYAAEGTAPVIVDTEKLDEMGISLYRLPVASWSTGKVRHDSAALSREVFKLYRDLSHTRIY